MTENELDLALSAPLAEIADEGFSQNVLLGVLSERARRERNFVLAMSGAVALSCALMPFTRFGQAVDSWAIGFSRDLLSVADGAMSGALNMSSLSLPLAVTAGALAVAVAVMQSVPAQIRRRPTSGPRTSS